MKKQFMVYYTFLNNCNIRDNATYHIKTGLANSTDEAILLFENYFVQSKKGILLSYSIVDCTPSIPSIKQSKAYLELKDYYGTNGSLLEPTNFGLDVLEKLDSDIQSKYAYCLIPLWFANKEKHIIQNYSNNSLYYLMEYIRISRAYRCIPLTDNWSIQDIKVQIGSIPTEVRKMLIADKVYMHGHFKDNHIKHKRAIYIQKYFDNWFAILNYTDYQG